MSDTVKEKLSLILKGACIGIADAIPGVSGGTIAVILKIYDRLLDAIDLKPKKLIKNLPFIIPMGIGILLGLFTAANILGYLFEHHNVPTQLFFMGIIAGSFPALWKECRSSGNLKLVHILPFVLSAAGILLFNMLRDTSADVALSPVTIIIMTAAAAAAMIMPGLSGALVLKILGGYDAAIIAVKNLDIITLLFYAVGAAAGLLGAAKLISLLLKKCRTGTYCAIIGLIAGSLPAIFPQGFALDTEGIIGIAALAVGTAVPLIKINKD